jgi:hypothetical protein
VAVWLIVLVVWLALLVVEPLLLVVRLLVHDWLQERRRCFPGTRAAARRQV